MTGGKRAACAAICLALAACTRRDVDHAGNALASAAPQFANDAVVYAKVESALAGIDPASALHVAVSAHGGSVRLSGAVRSAGVERRYVRAATVIPGVVHVDAALRVDPAIPNVGRTAADAALAARVRASLVRAGGPSALGPAVRTAGGAVTLQGTVASSVLKAGLLAAARSTPGVTRVVDRLSVRP